jgi:tetratricopeptide (TPR) repeat protein
MPYRIKIASKDQAPDEAQLRNGMERLLDVLQERRRAIVTAVGLLFVVVAALIGVGWYDHRQAQQAVELERQATKLYLTRSVDQPAKSEEQLKKAIELYRQVVADYPRAPVTPVALFRLGNALAQAHDVGGAIEAYTRYTRNYGVNQRLLGLVYQRLGYAYLVQGDRDQAVKAFTAVLEVPDTLNKDQVLFELGKLEETLSRPEGALARYQDLMKAYPNSPFASEAAVRMKALEAKKAPEASEPSSGAGPASPSSGAGRTSPGSMPVRPGQAPLPQGMPSQ